MGMQLSQKHKPCSALRGITKSSGLFDTGFPDDISEDDLKTINTFDLSSNNHNQNLSLYRSQSVTKAISRLVDDLDSDSMFNEKFMDLSNFLFPEDEMTHIESGETNIESVTSSHKRKASEAASTHPTPNPDHSDYTCKRQRLVSSTDSDEPEPRVMDKEKKYIERRQKNNVASRRSRETRKQKYVNMEQRAEELETENKELDIKVKEMELLTKKMKDILVKRLSETK